VQILTTVLKLTPMAIVIVAGLWLLLTEPSAYVQHLPTTPLSIPGTVAASTIALFAMLGIESATIPATKVNDPERTIPRATVVGAILTAMIYVAVTAVALLLIPQDVLAKSDAPFVDVLNHLIGAGGGRWLAFFILVSGLGALNGWTLLVAELTRTLAANKLLPAPLASNNRYGAPALALVVTAAFATIVTLMNYSKSLVDGFTFLSIIVTAANLPLYLCCALALVVLWRRDASTLPRSALGLGVAGAVYSVFAFIGIGREPFLWAIVLAAAGSAVLCAATAQEPRCECARGRPRGALIGTCEDRGTEGRPDRSAVRCELELQARPGARTRGHPPRDGLGRR
jgi:APA family basic amino acid/polyamine antiporter